MSQGNNNHNEIENEAKRMLEEPSGAGGAAAGEPKIVVEDFSAVFDGRPALRDVNLSLYPRERLAIIGPAGSGKTTFLRSLNRLNDLEWTFSHGGRILLDGQDIYHPDADVASLRRRLGMVYAVPTPLPWTIYENIAFGARLAMAKLDKVAREREKTSRPGAPQAPSALPKAQPRRSKKQKLDEIVESALKSAFLWDEVKDRLKQPAMNLSGGQQQRLCLARVLALEPEVLLLDEPCSGLDPISTAKIEEALVQLKAKYSIVLVTNNTKQAARASDRTAFFLMGELIEVGATRELFTNPRHGRTNDYITGHFG